MFKNISNNYKSIQITRIIFICYKKNKKNKKKDKNGKTCIYDESNIHFTFKFSLLSRLKLWISLNFVFCERQLANGEK